MNTRGYTPKKGMYVKMTPQVARALSALAQAQDGDLTDPRKVAWSIIEETLLSRGMIAEMSLPAVEWPGAATPDLLAVLEEVEWVIVPGFAQRVRCPWCKKRRDGGGHAPDCQRQAAIAKARGEK